MPSDEADPATLAARGELAELISQASGGLSDRDRVVLELAYRQGLDGPELAEALGVTPKNANTLVERLRDTIARSLGALLLYRGVNADPERCPELAAIVGQGDGEFTVLMRKRVARHIDGCRVCEEDRARMVTPAALLGATPIVIPAPAWLRQRTLDSAVVPPPTTTSAPVGPEDDASWWPPRDLDVDDLAEPPEPARRDSRARRSRGARRAPASVRRSSWSASAGARSSPRPRRSGWFPPTRTNRSPPPRPPSRRRAGRPPAGRSSSARRRAVPRGVAAAGDHHDRVHRAHHHRHHRARHHRVGGAGNARQAPQSTPVTTRPTPTQPEDDGSPGPVIDLPPIFDPPTDDPVTTPPPKPPKPTKPTVTVSRPPPVKVEPIATAGHHLQRRWWSHHQLTSGATTSTYTATKASGATSGTHGRVSGIVAPSTAAAESPRAPSTVGGVSTIVASERPACRSAR